ncbi:F-box protein At4g22390-like [Chenopodium quinoa]|uniref:F-box protein At4g22390-like n=1 Tax=Chenopodium quinoa TaxID=63459 RepID=UPI000B78BA86|nr:F-box protein At4g22390-like [Chenopodium quinoa]
MVYSLNDDSWKCCTNFKFDDCDEFYVDQARCNSGVLVHNHLLHWIMFSRLLPDKARNEEWSVVPLPDSVIEKYNEYCILKLRVLDDCLCLFMFTNEVSLRLGSYYVWIMKEYGVAKSWVELSGISDWVTNDKKYYYCGFLPPIAFCKERQEILLNQPDPWYDTARFYWFNLQEKTVRDARMQGIPEYTGMVVSWGSVVSISGGVQIGKEDQDGPNL